MPLTYATPLILTDPGFLFWAPPLTAEPTHVAAGSTYDADTWPAAWIPLGATEDGSKLAYDTKVEPIRVAEFFDPIRYSTVERSGSISFMLTNYTLKTVARVFNTAGATATVSGTGATLSSSFVLPTPGLEARAMIGWESLDHTMRVVMYQCLNSGTVETAFSRAPSKAMLPCTFQFEVPASGIPLKFYAAGAARLGT